MSYTDYPSTMSVVKGLRDHSSGPSFVGMASSFYNLRMVMSEHGLRVAHRNNPTVVPNRGLAELLQQVIVMGRQHKNRSILDDSDTRTRLGDEGGVTACNRGRPPC